MASWYERENSPFLWVKWFDSKQGKVIRESTNKLRRPSKKIITPCKKGTKDGERLAQHICEEIDAANKLDLGMLYFITPRDQISVGSAFQLFKNINSNKNIGTIKNYDLFFELFKKTFDEKKPIKIMTKQSTELWLSSIRRMRTENGKTFSQNYVYNFQKNLKKFLSYLFENSYLDFFKLSKDVQVKIEIGRKIIFKSEHIHKIFDNLHITNSNLRTCIYILTYTGLRSTDILSIRAEDIDIENETYQYYSPKLKKYIIVPIHTKLLPVLKERLSEIKEGPILEYSHHHAVRVALKRYLDKLGIGNFGYSPRTFRKSFDTWAYQSGMDTIANSRLAGHNITTAEKNYREVYMDKLRQELDKFDLPSVKNVSRIHQTGTQKGHTENSG